MSPHSAHRDILLTASILSLLLSAWCLFQKEVINYDTVLYLRMAELLTQGEWQASLQLYRWPFYPWLISLVNSLTNLGMEVSAKLLNALLTVFLMVGFVQVVATLGGTRSHQWAAVAILLCYPGLNDYRSFVIRDIGFLACYLFALLYFLRYQHRPHWQTATAWGCLVLLGGLFRIEGFAFLLLAPLLCRPKGKHSLYLLILYFSVPLALGSIVIWWFSVPTVTNSSQVSVFWQQIQMQILQQWETLREQVLPPLSSNHVTLVWAAIVVAIFLAEVLGRLTPFYALLAYYSYQQGLLFPLAKARTTWFSLLLVHTLILGTYVAVYTFLTGRHPLAFSFTLMLAVPFALVALHKIGRASQSTQKWQKLAFPASCLLLVAMLLDSSISLSPSKVYIKQAGQWIKTQTAPNARLYSNYHVLLYYAGKNGFHEDHDYSWASTLQTLQNTPEKLYDYVALRIKRREQNKEDQIWRLINRPILRSFQNPVGDRILVFDLRTETKKPKKSLHIIYD